MSDLRDPGDAWVTAHDGVRYWGRFGAAGLLAVDRGRSAILLQHRVEWSDHGGTWGIPGGARHQHEAAVDGAIRESQEEAGIPDGAVHPLFTHVLDREIWTYTTLLAETVVPFEPRITDPESLALAWVPCDEVEALPLHPGFATSWPILRPLLQAPPVVVVDGANVVGSVPDGWWRDRRGAAERLRDRLVRLAHTGVRSGFVELPDSRVPGLDLAFPEWVLVTEGSARGLESAGGVRIVNAPGTGDDAIVRQVRAAVASGKHVSVVTSDVELAARARAAGAVGIRSSKQLLKRLPELPGARL
ncbi:NUDIX domain-containing protein [Leucobacter sp. GX24907]